MLLRGFFDRENLPAIEAFPHARDYGILFCPPGPAARAGDERIIHEEEVEVITIRARWGEEESEPGDWALHSR